MTDRIFSHLSNPDEPIDRVLERAMVAIAEYPGGPRTKERRYRTLYALNDLVARIAALEAVRSRPHLVPERNGEIVSDPRVELVVIDREGPGVEDVGVLFQFAVDGSRVRMGLSYYPDDEDEDADREREASWRRTLAGPLSELRGAGFTLGDERSWAIDAEFWGAGWLAWREYRRGVVPPAGVIVGDIVLAVEAYDAVLLSDPDAGQPAQWRINAEPTQMDAAVSSQVPGPTDVFSDDPIARWLEERGEDRRMELTEAFTYWDPRGRRWDAPKGAKVDGASIPWPLWSIVGSPYTGDYRRASIVHDVACATVPPPTPKERKEADRMYYHACRRGGCSRWEAIVQYLGVRIGAWISLTALGPALASRPSRGPVSFSVRAAEAAVVGTFYEIASVLEPRSESATIEEVEAEVDRQLDAKTRQLARL